MKTINNYNVIYQAIFINSDDSQKLIDKQGEKLINEVKDIHCTFKFRPSETEIKNFSNLLGKNLELKVIGYCSDGNNSGYEVELSDEQSKAYTSTRTVINDSNIPTVERITPHITVSISETGKPVDTGLLKFSKKDFEPFIIHGRAGFFTSRKKDEKNITEIIYDKVLADNINTIDDTKEENYK